MKNNPRKFIELLISIYETDLVGPALGEDDSISIGHWIKPTSENNILVLPYFSADIKITLRELRKMLDEETETARKTD